MTQLNYFFKLFLLIGALTCRVMSDGDEQNEPSCYEPCGAEATLECVRDYFETYGECSVIRQDDDEPVIRGPQATYLPFINLIVNASGAVLKNVSGTIGKFCINNSSGNLVMSVTFEGVAIESPADFIIGRKNQQPLVLRDIIRGLYPSTLTATIPTSDGMVTRRAVLETLVTSFPGEDVSYSIGPNVTESEEPAAQKMLAGLVDDIPTALKEIFFTEGPSQFRAYLQKQICFFDVPINNLASGTVSVVNAPLPLN